MDIYCTRPNCPKPINSFADLDNNSVLKNVPQKFCITCGMPLILDGRYVPLKELKRGGFGAAFLACDRRTPAMRECVVKQLQPSANLNAEQMQKVTQLFHREAEVLETLGTHPQIPQLFAFFELQAPIWHTQKPQELFYLVQQYISGEDLEQELKRKGKFSEAEVTEVLLCILPVLEFVHARGAIHRDIKPSNIMRDGNNCIYLVDFGAVKQVVGSPTKQPSTSMPSDLLTGIYTPGFAPPEQTNCLAVYPSTDLYALAATCLYLLTGKLPKSLHDPQSKTWNWRSQVKVSDRFARILQRMLMEPSKRFQGAQEVLNALTQPYSDDKPKLTNLQWLIIPFFTGFEVGLLLIAFNNLLPTAISFALVGMILGGLIYAQSRRIFALIHLLILSGTTGAIVLLLLTVMPAALQVPIFGFALANNPLVVIFFAVFVGVFGIALIALSQLIYQLLARI